jgi:AraC-like DNA-binding protein
MIILPMKIKKFLPSAPINSFVKEFMLIESDLETDNTIIPDTAMVMAFRYRGNVSSIEGEIKESIPTSVVSGLRRSARLVYYSKKAANLLVVFKEGGFTAFTKMPAHELFGQSIPSENVFLSAELSEISERLAEAESDSDRINIMEVFLCKKLIHRKPDYLVGNAIQRIKEQSGIIRIKNLASSLHISQDPFEKRFRSLIGTTPKQYASIIRLRNLIRKYSSHASLTEASYEAGYFDQSHFIKDFRQFTGQAPKDFFASGRYW